MSSKLNLQKISEILQVKNYNKVGNYTVALLFAPMVVEEADFSFMPNHL